VDCIEQAASAKLLGVILHECLRFDKRVRYITATLPISCMILSMLRLGEPPDAAFRT